MPRLLGVDIPNNRPTAVALTYLYGVGPQIARELCLKAGVEPDFVFLTDPQYWAWRHLAGLSSPQSILVAEGAENQ